MIDKVKTKRFPKVFFGWWTVITGGFLALWSEGYFSYGFSALFKPIASELGFNRTVTSVATSIVRLEGAFEAPLTGWIIDRFGPRLVVMFGVVAMSLGLGLMYFVNSLWAFYVVWGVLFGTGYIVAVHLPMDTAISNWFVKKRGIALGVRMVFSGLSGVLVLPLIAWLIIASDWRMTCVIGGIVMGVVGLPMTWFFLRPHRPEYYGLLPDGMKITEDQIKTDQIIDRGIEYAAEVQEIEFTLRQAMKTSAYWLLLITNGIHSLAASAINVHCIPLLTDLGIDPLDSAGMMVVMVAVSIPPRPIIGLLADRISRNRVRFLISGALFLQGVGLSVFVLNQSTTMIYIWFILYGMGMGAAWTIASPVRARYFGRKAFGSITGSSMLFLTPVGMAAPIYLGWVHDTTDSYMQGLTVITVLIAIAAVAACFIVPPKPPTSVTDIRKIV
ncbi:MAG: MFS transporter [Dehalococcoidales bacterium]|nr:MAG: MFS transporter [Dehalococcoidales bacterium]